ncbi:MAG TPA: CHRD domain-containing protein, partial [Chloroflexia bacterium]|nr:CHRD domain-containing protein [Chloroflexia bacterium]
NVQPLYAGDYDYSSSFGTTAYTTWDDGRTLIGGSSQQDVYFDKVPLIQGTPTPTVTGTPPTATQTRTPTQTPTATATPCGAVAGWTPGPALPTTLIRAVGVYFPANGKFYTMGGRTSDAAGSDFQHVLEYTPGTPGSWLQKGVTLADNQMNNMACGVLSPAGTPYIYCVGGSAATQSTATARVFFYDPVADTATTLTSADNWPGDAGGTILPGGFVVLNNKLYVLGGFNINVASTNQIWEFNPSAAVGSRWTQKVNTPVGIMYAPTAAYNGLVYVLGASDYQGGTVVDTTTTFGFNPATNTISNTVAIIPRATGETRAVTVGSQLWVLGGGRGGSNPSNEVDVYTPASNSWSLGIPFTNARRNFPADTDGSRVWLAGGYEPSAAAQDMEIYRPAVACSTPTSTVVPSNTPTATATATNTATATSTPACGATTQHYFVATLTGGQETPPNSSPATGVGTFFLDASGTMTYLVTYQNLQGTFTASHLHNGAPGQAGPIIQPLNSGNPIQGSFTWNPAYTGSLLAGNIYVNIHSSVFPGGEIRGQLIEQCATPTVTATPPPAATATRTAAPTITPGPSATPCTLSFTDVHVTDYFYTPVLYLACHGVISGYSNGDGTFSFRPYNNTTRSQMVKIVVLGYNKPIVTPAAGAYTFTDVPPTNPFFAVVETAAADTIVSGYNCGGPNEPCDSAHRPYFRPYNNVTRGQLAKIDVVAAGWEVINPATGSFEDVLPGTAFYTFVETAVCHGVISGYNCGGPGEPCDSQNRPYYRQYTNATRGQITKIVYNSLSSQQTCGGPTATPGP